VRAEWSEPHLDAVLVAVVLDSAWVSCSAATKEPWEAGGCDPSRTSGSRSVVSGLMISVTSPVGTSRLTSGFAVRST
jgi:hypothetical protein